jgi:hypothetical protein
LLKLRLVWQDDIKPKDAIHVATALRYKCPVLETFDEPLVGKSGLHGLVIRRPEKRAQGAFLLESPREKDG